MALGDQVMSRFIEKIALAYPRSTQPVKVIVPPAFMGKCQPQGINRS